MVGFKSAMPNTLEHKEDVINQIMDFEDEELSLPKLGFHIATNDKDDSAFQVCKIIRVRSLHTNILWKLGKKKIPES